MKRYAALTAAFCLAIFIISCESESPTETLERITFEVTAVENNIDDYEEGFIICDDSLSIGGEYPVSIDFKPEIRIYPPDSTTYQEVELFPNTASTDPEYFGVTPCRSLDINAAPPCTPCPSCQEPWDPSCTCFGFVKPPVGVPPEIIPVTGNYRFTVTASNGKVVGLFKKKNYQEGFADARDDARLIVQVCINGKFVEALTASTSDIGGGIYIVVPID